MIKLKAVIKETKEIVDVSAIDFGSKHIKVLTENKKYESSSYTYFRFEDIILLKSTGLYDSKGVEIFEGDIVNPPNDTSGFYGIVMWNKTFAKFDVAIMELEENDIIMDRVDFSEFEELEIIGNIHTKEKNK